ncbi:MAG: hypothetical protein IT215_04655 [Chitinophagaceae bacterium]|nr:hypothetical protein [Chitinophagaceae bacterium]
MKPINKNKIPRSSAAGCFIEQEYFIDLTLQQFNPKAPKLSISKASNERVSGSYSSLSEGEPIKGYLERQRAFVFYTNPKTMQKPEYKVGW